MAHRIFFSWQQDRCPGNGQRLIQSALELAVKHLKTEALVVLREQLAVDHDTRGTPGAAPIVQTILDKISGAAVFVPDLTFVGLRTDNRPVPNPNVLFEYGCAFQILGWQKMLPVMNTAFGKPEELPFDFQHMRHPITYCCPDEATAEERARITQQLSEDLKVALKQILFASNGDSSTLQIAKAKDGPARFRADGQPLFLDMYQSPIHLTTGTALWLRIYPVKPPTRTLKEKQTKKAGFELQPVTNSAINGMYRITMPGRAADGYGAYFSQFGGKTQYCVFLFENGQIWSVNAAICPNGLAQIDLEPGVVYQRYEQYVSVLRELGITGDLAWEVGLDQIQEKSIRLTEPDGKEFFGRQPCLVDVISKRGVVGTATAQTTLSQFFEEVADRFDIRRDDQS